MASCSKSTSPSRRRFCPRWLQSSSCAPWFGPVADPHGRSREHHSAVRNGFRARKHESDRNRGARFCRRSDSGASQRQAVPAWSCERMASRTRDSRASNRLDLRTGSFPVEHSTSWRTAAHPEALGSGHAGLRSSWNSSAGSRERVQADRLVRSPGVPMVDRCGPIRTGGTQ